MGVQLYFQSNHEIFTKIVNIRARGLIMENPINFGQDFAPEDDLLEKFAIGVFPDLNSEAWE